MNHLQESIDKQIRSNRGKNLFFIGKDRPLEFTGETIRAILKMGKPDPESNEMLVDYATDKAIQEFLRVNQFFSIGEEARKALRTIYVDLFDKLTVGEIAVGQIEESHYHNLKQWLRQTNPFAEKIVNPESESVPVVTCAEYSPVLQMEILQLDTVQLTGPLLDIGCGKQGELVGHLREHGIEAYGIDRFPASNPHLLNADWLEFDYGVEKWGTMTSNNGFSNHFNHHHLRTDGNFLGYARKYAEILNALIIGGCFHYAPGLPFIERYLDPHRFQLNKKDIGNTNLYSVIIKRLS